MTDTAEGTEPRLRDRLVDSGSVLLLAPTLSGGGDPACAELLGADDGTDRDVLWVSYAGADGGRVDRFGERAGGGPAAAATIDVADDAGGEIGGDPGGQPPSEGAAETVTDPDDLTGLGIAISERLQEWNGDGRPTAVCFDSVTALLQYTDLDTAYEFLHVVGGKIQSAGAVAHFHMDPAAHDDRTLARVTTLMDAVVEFDGDDVAVRSR